MATIVHVLWLAVERARFSCNDQALLARCPKHILSVFNLIVDIHVMVNWQLSKRVSIDQCHMTVSQGQVYNSLRWPVFLKLSSDQPLVLIDRRLNYFQCFLLLALKGHIININLVHSDITGNCSANTSRPWSEISLQWPRSWLRSGIYTAHLLYKNHMQWGLMQVTDLQSSI